jgi:hypothetical protein
MLHTFPGFPLSFAHDRISAIAIAPDRSVWIGALKNKINDLFQLFDESKKCRLAMLKNEKWNHYPYFEIGAMAQDKQSRVVFTGTKMKERDSPGSFLVIVDNGMFDENPLPENPIKRTWIRTTSLCAGKNAIWIGTIGSGLLEFSNHQWRSYGLQNQPFKNSAIISIASNNLGSLSIINDSIAELREDEKFHVAWGHRLALASYHTTVVKGLARLEKNENPNRMQLMKSRLNTLMGFPLAGTPHSLYTLSGKRLNTLGSSCMSP